MSTARSVVAVSALAVALAVPLPAAAGTPITWVPLPAVEPGAQVTLSTDDLPALFQAGCGSNSAVQVTVGGQLVAAANLDWAIVLTLPLTLRPGAVLAVTAASCHAQGSQVLAVAVPIVAGATARVVTVAGGQETVTAGQPVTITGTGFGAGQGAGFAVLLEGQPCTDCQIGGWNAGEITATLPQGLATATYTLAVRTTAGTSPPVPLYVLSTSAAQALAAGKPVALPWAPGAGGTGGAGSGQATRSGTGSHAGGQAGSGGSGNPGGGGGGHHGAAWPWVALVALGSLAAAALAALAPWRRKRRVGAGQVQVQTPEPEAEEAQAAAPEAQEQDPAGGDTP